METKICKTCGIAKPLDREHFGNANAKKGCYWQAECRECMKTRCREHRLANAEKHQKYDQERRRTCPRLVRSDAEKGSLWERYHGICLLCGTPIAESDISLCEIDHEKPLSKGGKDEFSNLSLAHAKCNKDKHSKTLLEHWNWRLITHQDNVLLTVDEVRRRIGASSSGSKPPA